MTAMNISPIHKAPSLRKDWLSGVWEIVHASVKSIQFVLWIALVLPIKVMAFPLGWQINDRDLIRWDNDDESNLIDKGAYARDENTQNQGFSFLNLQPNPANSLVGQKIPEFKIEGHFQIPASDRFQSPAKLEWKALDRQEHVTLGNLNLFGNKSFDVVFQKRTAHINYRVSDSEHISAQVENIRLRDQNSYPEQALNGSGQGLAAAYIRRINTHMEWSGSLSQTQMRLTSGFTAPVSVQQAQTSIRLGIKIF